MLHCKASSAPGCQINIKLEVNLCHHEVTSLVLPNLVPSLLPYCLKAPEALI